MRTTIDVPDELLKKARPFMAKRKMTFRALVIDAVERVLEAPSTPFRLRDASAGHKPKDGGVSSATINRAIDDARGPFFTP